MKNLLTLVLLVSFQLQALGWGVTGHRVVGEIADHHLSRKARREIAKLLGHESLAMASNWADFIKSDPQYDYAGPWHYVNAPDNLNLQEFSKVIAGMEQPNAYKILMQLSDELKNPSGPAEERIRALKFIIHIVGDIHQPMHVGRESDLGGNRIQITWFGHPGNLHRLWDEELVDFQQLSYTEMAEAYDHASKEQIKKWQSDDAVKWLFESYKISRELYAQAEENTDLSYRYNYDHLATLRLRLLQGGVRLAGLLNEVFS